MAYIISADEIKKTLPGYDPSHSEDYHKESARLADKAFETAVRERAEEVVILMSGGTASGKSEYVSVYLTKRPCIVLDGTLPTLDGARIKIRKALKAGKRVEIHAVLPDDFRIAYIAFLNRDRKFSDEHFFRTHSQSRKTLIEIAKAFPEVDVQLVFSEYNQKEDMTMRFTQLIFWNKDRMIEFLELSQYTEEYIRKKVFIDHAA